MTFLRTWALLWAAGAVAGCGGDGGSASAIPVGASGGANPAASTVAPVTFQIQDVRNRPIEGAVVTLTGANERQQATTSAGGVATFREPPTSAVQIAIEARGFDTLTLSTPRVVTRANLITLDAVDAWAIGRALLLGSRTIDRAADGSSITVSVDVAVVGSDSQPVQALSSGNFRIGTYDCGWAGGRSCASDAADKDTTNGAWFKFVSPPSAFEWRGPSVRQPYSVGVLLERSENLFDWNDRVAALKGLFAKVSPPDLVSLSTVETTADGVRSSDLGPYTSDGRTYHDAIDRLGGATGKGPPVLESLVAAIRRSGTVPAPAGQNRSRSVLVLATPWLPTADIEAVTSLARGLGVSVSTLSFGGNWGFPEIAVRTGGFVAEVSDRRQLGYVMLAFDSVLAGTMPYYRMQFRLEHTPNTFVPGGNLKLPLIVDIPTPIINRGADIVVDVAIP